MTRSWYHTFLVLYFMVSYLLTYIDIKKKKKLSGLLHVITENRIKAITETLAKQFPYCTQTYIAGTKVKLLHII